MWVRRGLLPTSVAEACVAGCFPRRSQQSNEIRYSRLKCLKARDDAMQDVLKEAAAKLPALATGAGYATLLESLILEVPPPLPQPAPLPPSPPKARPSPAQPSCLSPPRGASARAAAASPQATACARCAVQALISLAETKVTVKGVQGQSAVVQKCLTPATAKYKDWASKNKDAAFVSAIDISFDSAPLPVGCAPAPTPSSACSPRSTAPLPPRHGARPSSLPRAASAASR